VWPIFAHRSQRLVFPTADKFEDRESLHFLRERKIRGTGSSSLLFRSPPLFKKTKTNSEGTRQCNKELSQAAYIGRHEIRYKNTFVRIPSPLLWLGREIFYDGRAGPGPAAAPVVFVG
jgi:hypothetical protein